MSKLSEKERQALPASDFAGPNRSFPIVDASDVEDAAHLIGKADDPEKVKARIIAIAKRKGFALPEAWKEGEGEGKSSEMLISFGGAVKATGEDRIGGYLVVFGSPDATDLDGEYFTAETNFDLNDGEMRSGYWNHGLDVTLDNVKIGRGTITKDDTGLYLDAEIKMVAPPTWKAQQIAKFEEYVKQIKEIIAEGKASLSSGALNHLVRRKSVKNSVWLSDWPLGEWSVTVTPAEPRARVMALKSFAESLSLAAKSQLSPDLGREATGAALSRVNDGLMNYVYSQMYHVSQIGGDNPDKWYSESKDAPTSKSEAMGNISAACDEHKAMCLKMCDAMMDDPDEGSEAKSWALAYGGNASDDPEDRTVLKALSRLVTDAEDVSATLSRRQERRAAAKSGRKLSKANIGRLKEIRGHMGRASACMNTMIAEHEPDADDTADNDDGGGSDGDAAKTLAVDIRNFAFLTDLETTLQIAGA